MILYFSNFKVHTHFHKDVVQFPLNLARNMEDSLTIFTREQEPPQSDFEVIKVKNFFHFCMKLLTSHDKTVVIYFLSSKAKLRCIVLRLLAMRSKIIVKADQDEKRFKIEKHLTSRIPAGPYLPRRLLNKAFFRAADQICVETRSVYEALTLIPEASGKLNLVPNGSSSIPAISEKENLILFVGRYESKQKNFDLFYNAIEECSASLTGWRIEVVGGERRESQTQSLTYRGSLEHSEVMQLFSKAKIFALSSIHEGSPIVFAEAKAAGCVILTTSVSASKDYVPSRDHGEIADPNITDYSNKLKTVIERCNRNEYDHDAIQDYFLECFDWKKTTAALADKLTIEATNEASSQE